MNQHYRRAILLSIAGVALTFAAIGVYVFLVDTNDVAEAPVAQYDVQDVVEALAVPPTFPVFTFQENSISVSDSNWRLDSSAYASDDSFAIFSAINLAVESFDIFSVDLTSEQVTKHISLPMGELGIRGIDFLSTKVPSKIEIPPKKLPGGTIGGYVPSQLSLSPDNSKIYVRSLAPRIEKFVFDLEHNTVIDLELPNAPLDIFWFSNDDLAYGGRTTGGSPYNFPYYQIYDIHTMATDTTKLPVAGAFDGFKPRVNPSATAYVNNDVTSNSGAFCSLNVHKVNIRSYPEGEELLTIENLHKVDYRWLHDGNLELRFGRVPEYDKSDPSAKPDRSIVCEIEEVLIYTPPVSK